MERNINGLFMAAIVIVLILIGGFLYFGGRNTADIDGGGNNAIAPPPMFLAPPPDATTLLPPPPAIFIPPPNVMPPPPPTTVTPPAQGSTKNIQLSGKSFAFSLGEIRVKKGDTVRVTFKNEGGSHNWRLEGYNVGTSVLGAGQEATVQFTADRTGQFEYYCSVGNHRQMGMKGRFVVEE